MTIKLKRKTVRRGLRIAAFGAGTGIAFLGAGNLMGIDALTSALFGASGAVLGLVGALLFIFAAKDELPDRDFDSAINQAIQQVQSKSDPK
jgi:uncharacterized oligopeptide transporter (OPT) family protein